MRDIGPIDTKIDRDSSPWAKLPPTATLLALG